MGAKYYPTVKDQKASLRFQQKQKTALATKKGGLAQPATKLKKK